MAADAGVTAISKDDDVLNEARVWREDGRDVAIATVIRTWGSSPRRSAATSRSIRPELRGLVSGGCIEGAVIHEAQEVIATGKPKILEYGVTNELAWEVGLACAGQVHVYVEKLD